MMLCSKVLFTEQINLNLQKFKTIKCKTFKLYASTVLKVKNFNFKKTRNCYLIIQTQ